MTKHLDNVVKRQLKKQKKLKDKKRKTPEEELGASGDEEDQQQQEAVEEVPTNKSKFFLLFAFILQLIVFSKLEMKTQAEDADNAQASGDGDDCPRLVDTSKVAIVKQLLSTSTFDELGEKVSEKTLRAIREMNFSHMTEIQAKSIPHLLEGK